MILEKRSAFGWGATGAGRANPVNGMVVHYDGFDQGLAAKPHSACRTYWKNTRSTHINKRGWADIGYAWGVCPHGMVFEGRGALHVQAAQPGGNATWISCTFMSGPGEAPTAAQIKAFRELRDWLRRTYGVKAAVRGHRDFVSTSCPGGTLYRMVKDGSLVAGGAAADWMEETVRKLPTIGLGDTGEDVETAQGLLQARSHPEVKITGVFDPVTKKAVEALQKWGGVDVDGVVGQDTWRVLLRVGTRT